MPRLTKAQIDRATYDQTDGKKFVLWDSDVPGLGLRVYPSGKKAFVLRYRVNGRDFMGVLGAYGVELTLDQARTEAGEWKAKARKGIDPLAERKASKARGKSLGDLLGEYVEDRKKHGKKTWAKDERRFELYVPSRLKARPACDVTRADILALHKSASHAPYEANRTVETIRHAFNLGVDWGYGLGANPAVKIQKYPETKRKVWIAPHEFPYIARAIDAEESVYVRGLLWLYMLTAARKSEPLGAKRADVDRTSGRIRLPDTKSGEEQFLTLSSHALAILDTLPVVEGNPYLFPSPIKRKAPMVNIAKPWGRVRDRATVALWMDDPEAAGVIERERARRTRMTHSKHGGRLEPTVAEYRAAAEQDGVELPRGFTHVRLHDLRRTAGSWLSAAGTDLNTIREGLRHASISTTLTYARLSADAARPAFEEHGKRVRAAAGGLRAVE